MIRKLLIANRGEIAVRIIRACREMGIQTVAVYSMADQNALHAHLADEAICIGDARADSSYLNMESIMSACIATGADAIHPGFGFLSENDKFARLCETCHVTFVGPPSDVMRRMGNKSMAREMMIKAGVPVIPGSQEQFTDAGSAAAAADRIGYPVIIKAALGGGGKGMRTAGKPEDFRKAFEMAQKEALASFADGTMYIEHYIEHPKHIEFQILADRYGSVVHLGERDCSVQRNHQKMIEESPCAALDDDLRRKMGETAVLAAKAAGYKNAGTIEFLLEKTGQFYFMEMNTRIQVEHPVTEMVCGLDLIKEQIRIAQGEALSFTQADIRPSGHAIECRINAEDPDHGFRPCPGVIKALHLPGGNGIRIDTAIYSGYEVTPFYDSMLAKIVAHAGTRKEAVDKMRSALGEVIIEGIETNTDYLYEIMNDSRYADGDINVDFIDEFMERRKKQQVRR